MAAAPDGLVVARPAHAKTGIAKWKPPPALEAALPKGGRSPGRWRKRSGAEAGRKVAYLDMPRGGRAFHVAGEKCGGGAALTPLRVSGGPRGRCPFVGGERKR